MSRSWQYIGFNKAAEKILGETKVVCTTEVIKRNQEGKIVSQETTETREPAYTREEYQRNDVWYGSELVLYRYTFDDGRVLEDYVQLEPWSSGPMTYLALRDVVTKEPVRETLWNERRILSGEELCQGYGDEDLYLEEGYEPDGSNSPTITQQQEAYEMSRSTAKKIADSIQNRIETYAVSGANLLEWLTADDVVTMPKPKRFFFFWKCRPSEHEWKEWANDVACRAAFASLKEAKIVALMHARKNLEESDK